MAQSGVPLIWHQINDVEKNSPNLSTMLMNAQFMCCVRLKKKVMPIYQNEQVAEKLEMSQLENCLNKYSFCQYHFIFKADDFGQWNKKIWEFNCSSFGPPRIEFYSTLHLQFGQQFLSSAYLVNGAILFTKASLHQAIRTLVLKMKNSKCTSNKRTF